MESGQTTYKPVFTECALSGAVFQVTATEDIVTADGTVHAKAGDVVAEIMTDENGYGETEPLYLGRYEVREIKAPFGYVMNSEPKYAELIYAGQEFEVRDTVNTAFENEYQGVRISLSKVMEMMNCSGSTARTTIRAFVLGYLPQKILLPLTVLLSLRTDCFQRFHLMRI